MTDQQIYDIIKGNEENDMYWFNSGNQTWPVKEDVYKKMTDVVNERDAAVAKLKCAAYGLDWNVYRYWWKKRREDEAWHEEH